MDLTVRRISSLQLYQQLYQAILPTIQEAHECQAITQRILGHYFQCGWVDQLVEKVLTLSPYQVQQLTQVVQRLQQHEPIQYVLGATSFLGRTFQVNPTVLIPRPETEEMVQAILQENRAPGLRVLDIGTGSGCIAITLQQALPQATVYALDIDPGALRTAQANAQRLGATLQWLQQDILHQALPAQRWDLIVSNPPYVRTMEQRQMQRRVVDYEPAQALFVPNEHPLLFYEKIAALIPQHLAPEGNVYLEINEAFGPAVASLLAQAGLQDLRLQQDLQGKDRWVSGRLPWS